MININRVLIQLNRAVEFANSQYPQEKALAVILFDNLIEVLLYTNAENIFSWVDVSSMMYNKKFDKIMKNNVIGHQSSYSSLLKFTKSINQISSKEVDILKFVHIIRNTVYHGGDLNEMKLDLAIIIYYGLLAKRLLSWKVTHYFTCYRDLPAYKQIDFGQGINNEVIFGHEDYYKNAVSAILNKLKFENDLSKHATSIIMMQIEQIRNSHKILKEEFALIKLRPIFYNDFRFLNIDGVEFKKLQKKLRCVNHVLIYYSFVREFKNEFDEIPDIQHRQQLVLEQLKSHHKKYKCTYPYWVDLDKIEKRLRALSGKDVHAIIKNFMDIQNKLSNLYTDINKASSDLHGYIQFLIDCARGK